MDHHNNFPTSSSRLNLAGLGSMDDFQESPDTLIIFNTADDDEDQSHEGAAACAPNSNGTFSPASQPTPNLGPETDNFDDWSKCSPLEDNGATCSSYTLASSLSSTTSVKECQTIDKIIFKVEHPIEFFYGRQNFIDDMHTALQTPKPANGLKLCVVHGLGGVGKSEVVKTYVRQFQNFYTNIIWINAQNEEAMTNSFLTLATTTHMRPLFETTQDFDPVTGQNVVHNVQKMLPKIYECLSSQRTLLIFDNAEKLLDDQNKAGENLKKIGLYSFLPSSTNFSGHLQNFFVLVTSWTQNWAINSSSLSSLSSSHVVLTLNPFTVDESMGFIFQEVCRSFPKFKLTKSNQIGVRKLVQILGGLPVTLGQAVFYFRERLNRARVSGQSFTVQNFVEEIQNEIENSRETSSFVSTATVPMVTTLWKLARKSIQNFYDENDYGAGALKLLKQMANLCPNFSTLVKFLPVIFPTKCSSSQLENLLLLLERYGLLNFSRLIDSDVCTIKLNRLLGYAILLDKFCIKNSPNNLQTLRNGIEADENDSKIFELSRLDPKWLAIFQNSSKVLANMLRIYEPPAIQRFMFNLALHWNFDDQGGISKVQKNSLTENDPLVTSSMSSSSSTKVKYFLNVPDILGALGLPEGRESSVWSTILRIARPILNEFFFEMIHHLTSENVAEFPVLHYLMRALTTAMIYCMDYEAGKHHLEFCCDGCAATPILGTRYKCMACPDFDLCEECFGHDRRGHAHQSFWTISLHQDGDGGQQERQVNSELTPWLPVIDKKIPENRLLIAGRHGDGDEKKFVMGRARLGRNLVPGKVPLEGGGPCHISWEGKEEKFEQFETLVLKEDQIDWLTTNGKEMVPGSIAGGITANEELLFIGRISSEQHGVQVGVVPSRQRRLCVFVDGVERWYSNYEILVLKNVV